MRFRFDPPAGLDDLDAAGRDAWHGFMTGESRGALDELMRELRRVAPTASLNDAFYVDPTKEDIPTEGVSVAAPEWGGFPNALVVRCRNNRELARWRVEELGYDDHRAGVQFVTGAGHVLDMPSRHFQDEYLEWRTEYDDDDVVTKVTFTCEGYDYWEQLFAADESKVLALYHELLGDEAVKLDDLRCREDVYTRSLGGKLTKYKSKGDYNPRNRFNLTSGPVHLSHRANSLSAEIGLAIVASVLREDGAGNPVGVDNETKLCCCGRFGGANRDSDPTIGAAANALAAAGRAYTLTNPVGLYIKAYPHEDLKVRESQEKVPKDWWRVERGHETWEDGHARILRLVLEVPEGVRGSGGRQLRVGDLEIANEPIRGGAQLAERMKIHLMVSWWQDDTRRKLRVPCKATGCADPDNPEVIRVVSPREARACETIAFPELLPPEGAVAAGAPR